MPYTPPSFNLVCNIYTSNGGPGGVLRIALQPCQLRAPSKYHTQVDSSHLYVPLWELLFPALTDVRDYGSSSGGDGIEVPAGSGRYYSVGYVDDVAKGFPNEYRMAFVAKRILWPTPIP